MKITSKITCWLCLALLGSMFLFNSCSTDFEVNAPYDNIPVVYGLLNQNDSIHIIKINKTFLGEGNAILAASVPDSSIYQNLTGYVEEWIGGVYQRTFTLSDTMISNIEPGIFAFPEQKMYYFYADDLDEDAEYRLHIDVNEGGKEADATTVMVSSFAYHVLVVTPAATVGFHNGSFYTDYNIQWSPAPNGNRYEPQMDFVYWDVTTTDTVRRVVEFKLGEIRLEGNSSGTLSSIVVGETFYQLVEDRVNQFDAEDPAPGTLLFRKIGPIHITVTVAGEELDTYMAVNEPITGIVSERPTYSNISGGIGLFASRYQQSVFNKLLGMNTMKHFCEGPELAGMGFCLDTIPAVWSTVCHCP